MTCRGRRPAASPGTAAVGSGIIGPAVLVTAPAVRALGRLGRLRLLGRRLVRPFHGLVELVVAEVRLVERVAAASVGQREARRGAHVVRVHRVRPAPRGVRDGGAREDDVGAHPVDLHLGAQRGDAHELGVGQRDRRQPGAGVDQAGAQGVLVGGEPCREPLGVGVVGQAAAHDLGAQGDVARGRDVHGEPEAVEQLGPQLALLRVHGADQQERRGVGQRDAVALDVRATRGGGVEEEVDEVVVEQVDLVDVEHAAVRGREQPGAHGGAAVGEDLLEVQRPGDPVLRRPDRQLHQPHRASLAGRVGGERSVGALLAGVEVDREAVTGDDLDRRQQRRERPDDRRLRRALLPAHQHAADARVDRGEHEGQPQVLVADHGREREGQRVSSRRGSRVGRP
ncbi:MAG: hypothetical protein K0S40_4850 [Actinomycetospora sp.]|nr:hypothetical protein [Actinomycetospora sp.]